MRLTTRSTSVVYEAVPYIENWVNTNTDASSTSAFGLSGYFYNTWKKRKTNTEPPPYTWDDLGNDAEKPLIGDLEWIGDGPPSSGKGAWMRPGGKETFHPDFDHGEPKGKHWDYTPDTKSKGYRLFPDGTWEPK